MKSNNKMGQQGSNQNQNQDNKLSAARQNTAMNEENLPIQDEAQNKSSFKASGSKDKASQCNTQSCTDANQQYVGHQKTATQNKSSMKMKSNVDSKDIDINQEDSQDSHKQTANRAYEIYEQGGQAQGQCDKNWEQAESENESDKD